MLRLDSQESVIKESFVTYKIEFCYVPYSSTYIIKKT